MHPELARRIQEGQLKMAAKMPPEKRPAIDRTKLNPLPQTKEGGAILQQLHNCPMAHLTKALDGSLRAALEAKNMEELDRLYPGTRECIVADLACQNNLKTRVMVRFADDDELSAMTQQMGAIALEASALAETLKGMENEYNRIEEERFNKAAVKFGLNLKERSYRLNEVDECIELVEPNCAECASVAKLKELLHADT